jgi:hypothetical protein
MRAIITLLLSILAITSNAKTTYQKLCEVNKVWKEQDISVIEFPVYANYTEQQWIKLHLSLVEQTLRAKHTDQLTIQQQHNRSKALDHLHDYWQTGSFPQNEDYSYRTPIFIDRQDNFCAVGYLVKATGYEHVSRKISANTNLAYVRDMRYEGLFAWANEYGFTVDELAWIQPTYAPPVYARPVGSGFSGRVSELYVDPAGQNLYVGGTFINNSTPEFCYNIARVTNDGGFEWHNMGAGVNGRVDAIAQFVNDVFVAGSFSMAGNTSVSNIAKWNGSDWQAAGCIQGSVKDMVVYSGRLYACGNFTICADPTPVNFAVWTGATWQSIPGVIGTVNTMEVVHNDLFLGGNFNHLSIQVNAVKWNEATGFSLFGNPIQNEVNDFVTGQGRLFAYCKHTSHNDSGLIHTLLPNDTWLTTYKSYFTAGASFNSGCEYVIGGHSTGKNILGGSFNSNTPCPLSNTAMVTSGATLCTYPLTNTLRLDNNVYKVVMYKGHIVLGGDFSEGICREITYHHVTAGADMLLNNCDGSDGNVLALIWNGFGPYKIEWSTGELNDTLYNKPPGTYTVIVTDSMGDKDTASVIIGPVNFGQVRLDTANYTILLEGMNQTFYSDYKWVDCNTGEYMRFGWDPFFQPEISGNYKCIITLNGCTDTTNCIYVEVPTNSIKSLQKEHVVLYPNPVTDVLHVSLAKSQEKLTVTICDLAGRVITQQSEQDQSALSIDMSILTQGIYTATITYADGTTTMHKIVKQ